MADDTGTCSLQSMHLSRDLTVKANDCIYTLVWKDMEGMENKFASTNWKYQWLTNRTRYISLIPSSVMRSKADKQIYLLTTTWGVSNGFELNSEKGSRLKPPDNRSPWKISNEKDHQQADSQSAKCVCSCEHHMFNSHWHEKAFVDMICTNPEAWNICIHIFSPGNATLSSVSVSRFDIRLWQTSLHNKPWIQWSWNAWHFLPKSTALCAKQKVLWLSHISLHVQSDNLIRHWNSLTQQKLNPM